MKKLIFLLLALTVGVGLVMAGPAHPPGAMALDEVLPGNGVEYRVADYRAVTPDTVLAIAPPLWVQPATIQAVAVMEPARPQHGGTLFMLNTGQTCLVPADKTGFYLRC